MRLTFLNPLWIAAALAAVPLLAHLFSRTRPRRQEFPSIRLLSEALRRVTRVRQPRDRWLLILRTLAMIALALAFLQPLLVSRFTSRSNVARTLVVAVDVSASMGYVDGTRTRLAQAAAAAEELLGNLPSNSRANVVWIGAHPGSVLPEPAENLDFLRQELRRAAVRSEPGDISGSVALALKQLGDSGDGEKELAIISDFQRSNWKDAHVETPPGIRLTRVAVGEDEASNVGIGDLSLEPARPVIGQEARVICRISNFSAEPRRTTVLVEAGESRLSQTVELSPWAETLAVIPFKFSQEGTVPLRATLTEDRFPGDDVRYALAEVRRALRVEVAGPDEDVTAKSWVRAAGALDSTMVRRVPIDGIGHDDPADILFVSGWDGRQIEALQQQIQRGGALVLQPAAGVSGDAVKALLKDSAGAFEGAFSTEAREVPGWSLRIANEEHPLFALFSTGTFGDPVSGRFQRRVAQPLFSAGTRLLSFDDDRPALTLLDVPTQAGRKSAVAWWNLDLSATDWPMRSGYVAFFGEFLRYLGQRTQIGALRSFDPGDTLWFDVGVAIDPADVHLLDGSEHEHAVKPESPGAPGHLVTTLPTVPGAYRWMAQGSVLDRAFVNFPATESDLRRLTSAELESAGGSVITDAAHRSLTDLRSGKPIWPWCLAAAAALFVAEGILLWRLGAVRKNSGPQQSASASNPSPVLSK